MARIGVCLSGCGVNDGAEIHESVITALTLDRAGAEIIYTAPDVVQTKVVNHLTGEEINETRNVLVESARIARGDITDLAQLTSDDMDALLFPGGFDATLNLCDFALKGADCHIPPGGEADHPGNAGNPEAPGIYLYCTCPFCPCCKEC